MNTHDREAVRLPGDKQSPCQARPIGVQEGGLKKTALAAGKAVAAQRKNPKTTLFGFFPRIPARTAG